MITQDSAFGEIAGWVFLFVLFCGGGIAAGWDKLMAAIGGRPRRGLSRKQVKQLQWEHASAFDFLRELQAYDKYAATPLTTELSDKLNAIVSHQTLQIERKTDA